MNEEGTPLEKLYEEGKSCLNSRDYKKAIKLFTKAIKAFDPHKDEQNDISVIVCARSASHFHAGNFIESQKDAETTIITRPNWSKGYFRKGEALLAQDKRIDALTEYEKAKSLESDLRSIDIIENRILRIKQLEEDSLSSFYFKQILPGKDICSGTFNPIKKLVFEFGKGMQNAIYAIGDKSSRVCLLVDVCWDADGVIEVVRRDGITPIGCIVTHNHFDHVGGKPPAPFRGYGINVQGVATILNKYPVIPVYVHCDDADAFQTETGIDPGRIVATNDGMTLKIGDSCNLKFIHTPGHTPGSQCILINEARLLTGDTLFFSSCGRMDLPGGCPIVMHDTLQNKLARLPDKTVVYPGHTYNGVNLTTIKREKTFGVLKEATLEDWLRTVSPPKTNNHTESCRHT